MAFQFKSVKNRLNVWFLLVAIVPLITVISIIYQQRVESIKEEAFQKLIAIRDIQASQINNWLIEKRDDIETMAELQGVRRALNRILDLGEIGPHDLEKMAILRDDFQLSLSKITQTI